MKSNILLAVFVTITASIFAAVAADPNTSKSAASAKPVDDDMHHLMEYVFEPAWKRLQVTMASEPNDKKAWKAMKADSLTLAEVTNLLLHRMPKENSDDWVKLAGETRAAGSDFYQASRKKDFPSASKSYRLMLKNCNACHDAFADGEHQLAP